MSNTINCEEPGGEHIEGQARIGTNLMSSLDQTCNFTAVRQAKFEEGMRIFRLKTSNATVVLFLAIRPSGTVERSPSDCQGLEASGRKQ